MVSLGLSTRSVTVHPAPASTLLLSPSHDSTLCTEDLNMKMCLVAKESNLDVARARGRQKFLGLTTRCPAEEKDHP